jgi:hypothetical protein
MAMLSERLSIFTATVLECHSACTRRCVPRSQHLCPGSNMPMRLPQGRVEMCHREPKAVPHLEDDAKLALANLLAQADISRVNLQQPGLSAEQGSQRSWLLTTSSNQMSCWLST